MSLRRNSGTLAWAASLAALAIGAGAWALGDDDRVKPELGLMTTLPIYWAETESIGEALDGEGAPHWARTALERDYRLAPLDTLDGGEGGLGGLDLLLLAQPRALSPAENVALDDWVRGGGRMLLFADPFLTGGSRFHIGDRRRPQDVVLLSPILRHWGLDLRFDADQPEGERMVETAAGGVPVNLPGSLAKIPTSAAAECTIGADGLVATCQIGKGRAVVVADAALLDQARDPAAARPTLASFTAKAFAK